MARRTGGAVSVARSECDEWEMADSEWIDERSSVEVDGVRTRKQTFTRYKVVRWWSSEHEKVRGRRSRSDKLII